MERPLVTTIVQLYQPGMGRAIFEVKRDRLKYIGAKLFPSLGLRKDGVAQTARAISTLVSVANFEDQFHSIEYLRSD